MPSRPKSRSRLRWRFWSRRSRTGEILDILSAFRFRPDPKGASRKRKAVIIGLHALASVTGGCRAKKNRRGGGGTTAVFTRNDAAARRGGIGCRSLPGIGGGRALLRTSAKTADEGYLGL